MKTKRRKKLVMTLSGRLMVLKLFDELSSGLLANS